MTKNDIWGVLAPPRGWFERQIIFWTTRIIFRTEGRNFYNFPKNLRLWVMWGSETKNVKKLIFKRITGICRITKLIERVLAHPATSVSGERSALWLLYSIPLAHSRPDTIPISRWDRRIIIIRDQWYQLKRSQWVGQSTRDQTQWTFLRPTNISPHLKVSKCFLLIRITTT